MPIQLLAPEVASQIAAGEVVERPASVVKELLENCLDAGAKNITIKVEAAGKKLIEVADDGRGIPADELKLAVARHATSKLRSAADLFRIVTLGFRGEALASLGSVSRMTLTSAVAEAPSGAQLVVDGGFAGETEPVGAARGTVVRVEDLFYNVPARLKFLKTDVTEKRQIDELVTRYALAYSQVRFHLMQDGRTSLKTTGSGDRREVLAALYGVDVARQMLEVLAVFENIKINGYISPLQITRSNRREITFFVNGRWVQDATLVSALVQAYHTLLMVGRYPLAAVFLELPVEEVDANVHPAKAEVRFRNKDLVFSAVQRSVKRALMAYTPVPELAQALERQPWGQAAPAQPKFPADHWGSWETEREPSQLEAPLGGDELGGTDLQRQRALPGQQPALLRLVGQIANTYLAAEGPDGLYLIDQHAAHERVLFERFLSQRSHEIPSQRLLESTAVELSPQGARLIHHQLPVLERLGFEVEPFGTNTFLVRSLPALFAHSDPGAALRVLVEDFEEDETPFQAELEKGLIARICKRAAVKGGQSLSVGEQQSLLADLEACESPRTCPHGRPTMIHLSVDLLEKSFGRKGPR